MLWKFQNHNPNLSIFSKVFILHFWFWNKLQLIESFKQSTNACFSPKPSESKLPISPQIFSVRFLKIRTFSFLITIQQSKSGN